MLYKVAHRGAGPQIRRPERGSLRIRDRTAGLSRSLPKESRPKVDPETDFRAHMLTGRPKFAKFKAKVNNFGRFGPMSPRGHIREALTNVGASVARNARSRHMIRSA